MENKQMEMSQPNFAVPVGLQYRLSIADAVPASHNISQFENHIRAICGLEQIKIKKKFNAKMINLIGDEITPYRNKTFKDNEFFYDYLKKDLLLY